MDVLEEVTGDPLSRAHVERRLDDWERRIRRLYETISSWLDTNRWISIVTDQATRIDEEPMRAVDIPARTLPSLTLVAEDQRRNILEPRGLWIVGANGRIDLVSGASRYIIVDIAENFTPPKWIVMPALDRSDRVDFTSERLRAIL